MESMLKLLCAEFSQVFLQGVWWWLKGRDLLIQQSGSFCEVFGSVSLDYSSMALWQKKSLWSWLILSWAKSERSRKSEKKRLTVIYLMPFHISAIT